MNKEEKIEILKKAHQEYIDWWLPIDVSAGSVMAPVSFRTFLIYLLTMPDSYWDKWIGNKIDEHKTFFKQFILSYLMYEN